MEKHIELLSSMLKNKGGFLPREKKIWQKR